MKPQNLFFPTISAGKSSSILPNLTSKLTFRDLNAVASGLGAWVGVIKKTTSENFTYVDESPVTYLPFDEDNVRLAPRYSGTALTLIPVQGFPGPYIEK